MRLVQVALAHTADISQRLKALHAELDEAARQCGGKRKRLYTDAKMKSEKSMNFLEEVRKNLLQINRMLHEKQRKANSGEK